MCLSVHHRELSLKLIVMKVKSLLASACVQFRRAGRCSSDNYIVQSKLSSLSGIFTEIIKK